MISYGLLNSFYLLAEQLCLFSTKKSSRESVYRNIITDNNNYFLNSMRLLMNERHFSMRTIRCQSRVSFGRKIKEKKKTTKTGVMSRVLYVTRREKGAFKRTKMSVMNISRTETEKTVVMTFRKGAFECGLATVWHSDCCTLAGREPCKSIVSRPSFPARCFFPHTCI